MRHRQDKYVAVREILRGKDISRALANQVLARWKPEIHGLVLDLGCGRQPGYRRVMGLDNNIQVRLVGVDYDPSCRPEVVADLTGPFPFKKFIADAVICSHFLSIPLKPWEFLQNVRQVLKTDGLLIVIVHVVGPTVRQPTAYWRLTEGSLQWLVAQAGFETVELVPFGERWSVAAYALSPFLRPRRLIGTAVFGCSLLADTLIQRFVGQRWFSFPLGYCLKAKAV